MNANAPQPNPRLPAWAAALLLPAGVLAWWWFRHVLPQEYLAVVYAWDLPFAMRVPLLSVFICAAVAACAKKISAAAQENPLKPGVSPALVAVAIAVALLLCATAAFGTGLLLNFLPVAAGAVALLAACGFGLRLIELSPLRVTRERFDSPLERLVLSTALGLGVLALLMFIGGALGILSPWPWWLLLALWIAAGWGALRGLLAGLNASARGVLAEGQPFALALICFVAIWCVAHVVLLWSPPLEYDVLEYHLAAPAQYLREGRVHFLQENIYATMPQNGEMLYLLGMVLCGGKYAGLPASHAILMGAWILSICGVFALASRLLRGAFTSDETSTAISAGASLGAALFAITPLATQVAADFYVEHIQTLFHLGALTAACAFLKERRAAEARRSGWLVLAGVLAGFACGTKYPALLLTLAPLLVLLPIFCLRNGSVAEALRAGGTVGFAALFTFAPWLLRNFLAADDPLYPLGKVLQRRATGGTADDHLTHFDVATRSGERDVSAFFGTLRRAWPGFSKPASGELPLKRFINDAESGPALLFFALPGVMTSLRGELLFVALFFALDVAVWFLFTYRINRFLYAIISPLAVLCAVGAARLWLMAPLRKAVAALAVACVLLFAPLSMLYVWLYTSGDRVTGAITLEKAAEEQFHAFNTGQWFDCWKQIDALPEQSRVLFVGDAQTFYLDKTPEYAVVFNPQLLEKVTASSDNGAAASMQLSARGVTHLYISYSEWFRLDTSYAVERPEPGADWRQAKWDERKKSQLRGLLNQGELSAYRRAFPAGVQPAYLKLTPREYAIVEELLKKFTVVEHAWPNSAGQTSCELRRLLPAR